VSANEQAAGLGDPAGGSNDFFRPMTLRGFYYDEESCRIYRKKITVRAAAPEEGHAAGRELAAAILAEAKAQRDC
jgi:hypothetical protein